MREAPIAAAGEGRSVVRSVSLVSLSRSGRGFPANGAEAMTHASRLALSALLLAALAAATPLAAAQSGPPPGYDDPAAYAQDYAADQAAQASNDTVGYAGGKATPEGLGNESTHAAWLACWALYEYADDAERAADPACSLFFVRPVTVDAPADAEANVTDAADAALNATGADAFLGEALDAVNDTAADPTTAVDQVMRVVDAAVAFVQHALDFVLDAVLGLVDTVLGILGIGGESAAAGALGALDGLLGLLALPAKGLGSAVDGLASLAAGTADAAAAAVDGVAALAGGLASGVAGAVGAVASGLGSLGRGLAEGASSGASAVGGAASGAAHAVGDAAGAVGHTVSDAVHAVGHAVASLFGGHEDAAAGESGSGPAGGLRTGTDADTLVDRVLKLV